MIDAIAVNNFRCFKNLDLAGLKRVNIIVGRNAAGKTALLESIFLAAGGSPELALRFRGQRGLGRAAQISVDRQSFESLWKDLFYLLDQSKTVSIEVRGSTPSSTRSLRIAYKDQSTLTLPLGKSEIESFAIVPIVFEWRDGKDKTFPVEVKIAQDGLVIGNTGETIPIAFYSSTLPINPGETSARFSDLSKQNKEQALIEAFKREFPYVEKLSVEVSAGVPTIYASVQSLPEKLPLGMISGGVNKLLSLLVAIATYPNGIVLVDEIENGFYHERFASLWVSILNFCKLYNTQFFATTHSVECLRAILPLIRGNENELCLIRTQKENGVCRAMAFDSSELESALEQEIEVR